MAFFMNLIYQKQSDGAYYVGIREDWPMTKAEAIQECREALEWLCAPNPAQTQEAAPSQNPAPARIQITPDPAKEV
jgi:hypothetical protein